MKYQIIILIVYFMTYYCGGARTVPGVSAPLLNEFAKDKVSQQLRQLPIVNSDGDEVNAETLRFEAENNGIDKYSFAYDTSNGISRTEEGTLKETEDGSAIIVQGSTSWTAPDGKRYEFSFNADETGYHPIFKLIA